MLRSKSSDRQSCNCWLGTREKFSTYLTTQGGGKNKFPFIPAPTLSLFVSRVLYSIASFCGTTRCVLWCACVRASLIHVQQQQWVGCAVFRDFSRLMNEFFWLLFLLFLVFSWRLRYRHLRTIHISMMSCSVDYYSLPAVVARIRCCPLLVVWCCVVLCLVIDGVPSFLSG